MKLDARTAFIALTHDPKIDDPALTIALKSDCFYIGALGSKKTQAARHERLSRRPGCSPTRICGPIGLDIGARGAPEIAISIIAEMTRASAAWRGKS
jgi:xanthine dehydrogenase accessory factor